ncbi:MAG TPA: hypothetical protein VK255_03395 [Patescibacteria group bacterium]|nr:hypothetical protein [Patescibacteria group bacterium]
MNEFRPISKWRIKLELWKFRLKSLYTRIYIFSTRYPPLKYIFYTLHYFEVEDRYRKKVKDQRRLGVQPSSEERRNIREKSEKDYLEDLSRELRKSSEAAEKARRANQQLTLKLNQFERFLLEHLDEKQAIDYANKLSELVDPKDMEKTLERVSKFIDDVMKK